MKSMQKGFTAFELFATIILVFGVGGWIANIVKIVSTLGDVLTGLFIARCIGVFVAPLGAILGYI